MSIYRGPGGAGDAVNDSSSEAAIVTTLVDEATAQAAAAESSASASASSAASAFTQASNAAASALAAETAKTAAELAETNAETAEANAETAEANAETAQAAAEAAQAAAETAQTAAELAETNAETAETNAETAAATATTQAGIATTKAGEASTSATAAATAATNAAASYDSFDDRYLGAKSVAPSVDNDGNTLLVGALYFSTTSNFMKVWDGSNWLDAYASVSGAITSVTASAPIVSSGGANPDISIGAATTSASGYLTSTDWNTFNNKLGSSAIGSTVQGYDADTAKYDDTTANFTGTLQKSGSNVLTAAAIGSTVQAYDATLLNDADIGVTVQGYDATTLKSAAIGSTVQAYDADTAKTDVAQTFTAKQTFSNATGGSSKFPNILEAATVSATAATGTVNFDTITQSVLYYTSNASGNFTVNFRGDGTTSLNTLLATGESISASFLVTNNATAYYNSAVQVDGSSVTPKWQGGTAPTSGNASSVDVYNYVIIKTGSATFTVLASVTKFA